MLPVKFFLPLITIGVGGVFVASACNRFTTETRIDRSDFEKVSSVSNIYKEKGEGIKLFLKGNKK